MKKLKSENTQKSSFLCLCYILRAIRAGRCIERRYADHVLIHIYMYFRMHHFVVKFPKFSSPQAARGIDPPLNQKSCGRSCVELSTTGTSELSALGACPVCVSVKPVGCLRRRRHIAAYHAATQSPAATTQRRTGIH